MDIVTSTHAETYIKSLQFLAKAKGDRGEALGFAKAALGPNHGTTKLLEKSFISGGDISGDPDFEAIKRGFLSLVASHSLIGRTGAWRRVPFNTKMLRKTTASGGAGWSAQGESMVLRAATFEAESLERRRISEITAATNEIATANFTSGLSRDLVSDIAFAADVAAVDPAIAGDDATPRSMTYDAIEIPSTGSDGAAVLADFSAIFGAATAINLASSVIWTTPQIALQLSFLQDPLGKSDLGVRGGSLFGVPVFTSPAVQSDSSGGMIILLDPSRILLADEGVDISLSRQASVQVSGGDDASGVHINFWQQGLVGFASTRYMNWKPAPGSVVYLSGVAYGASA